MVFVPKPYCMFCSNPASVLALDWNDRFPAPQMGHCQSSGSFCKAQQAAVNVLLKGMSKAKALQSNIAHRRDAMLSQQLTPISVCVCGFQHEQQHPQKIHSARAHARAQCSRQHPEDQEHSEDANTMHKESSNSEHSCALHQARSPTVDWKLSASPC